MAKTLQITGDSAYGGAGYLLLHWCRFLLSKGWQVDILATDQYWVSELKKIPNLRVIDDIYIPRQISPVKDFKALRQLVKLIRNESYDVVQTYTATPGFIGRMAARLAGTPVILHHQAGWTVTEFSSMRERLIYTPLEYLATLASTKDICVSHAVKQQAEQLHIAPLGKLVVVCNGIDAQPFIDASQIETKNKLIETYGIPAENLLIGNTGRLSTQKDNATLIRAAQHLKSFLQDVPFTVLLAGDGPERSMLEDLIDKLQLGEQVRMIGFITDIPSFLTGIDIFVSPSLWEGLSISVLEAMAAEKPIVTTSILPNAELIDHEITGLLVPPKSPEEVAKAITRFAREPQLARECALAARKKVLEKYTLDRMFQETYDLYLEAFNEVPVLA